MRLRAGAPLLLLALGCASRGGADAGPPLTFACESTPDQPIQRVWSQGAQVEVVVRQRSPVDCGGALLAPLRVNLTVVGPAGEQVAATAAPPKTYANDVAAFVRTTVRFEASEPGRYHVRADFEPSLGIAQAEVVVARRRSALDAGEVVTLPADAGCRALQPLPWGGMLCDARDALTLLLDGGVVQALATQPAHALVEQDWLWLSHGGEVSVLVPDGGRLETTLSQSIGASNAPLHLALDGGALVVTFPVDALKASLDNIIYRPPLASVLYTAQREALGEVPEAFSTALRGQTLFLVQGGSTCAVPVDFSRAVSCESSPVLGPVGAETGRAYVVLPGALSTLELDADGGSQLGPFLSLVILEPNLTLGTVGDGVVVVSLGHRFLAGVRDGELVLEDWEADGFELLGADEHEVRGLRPDGTWVRVPR